MFNHILSVSDINTTLKIGISITWSFTLRYFIATTSLWCWKKISYNDVTSILMRSRSIVEQSQGFSCLHLYMFCMKYNFSATLLHAFLLTSPFLYDISLLSWRQGQVVFCSNNISFNWIEKAFLPDISPKVQFIFKPNPNLSFFSHI